jgi:hypothetical protein
MDTRLHEPERALPNESEMGTRDLINYSPPTDVGMSSPEVREDGGVAPLFVEDEAKRLRSRWEKIQIGFVDQPREAVQQADELVAAAIKRLIEIFATERDKLEHEWDRGEVSTEDLRVALRRHRTFFDRLLKV